MANINQVPGVPFNLAYGGVVPVALTGIGGADNFVVQVYDRTNSIKLADLRQSRNENDAAMFDIAKILQSFLFPSKNTIETTVGFTDSTEEVFQYKIRYGTETGGVVTIDGTVGLNFVAINGRKKYYEVLWDQNSYRPFAQGGTCVVPRSQTFGTALTDFPTYTTTSQLLVRRNTPDYLDTNYNADAAGVKIFMHKVRSSDYYTLSWLNSIRYFGFVNPLAKGVAGIRVTTYDQFAQGIDDFIIPAITANGGGPDTTQFEGKDIVDPWWVITAGVGPSQLAGYAPQGFGQVAFYYVSPVTYSDASCNNYSFNNDLQGYSVPIWNAHRFEIDNGICLDTPIQFSWMNSFGFRDYYTFSKRNRKSANVRRNVFLKDNWNWNGTSFSADRRDRGYTIMSQEVSESYTATTDYLKTQDSQFLENMVISPDVRVNLGDGVWLPVVLETNTWQEINDKKDGLVQLTVQFRLSQNIDTQRG